MIQDRLKKIMKLSWIDKLYLKLYWKFDKKKCYDPEEQLKDFTRYNNKLRNDVK